METIPILTIKDVAEIDDALSSYLDQSESSLALLIDKGGNILSQQGKFEVGDVTIVAALAAGSFAATKELARRIGEREFSALYHQGDNAHLFMQGVDDDNVLVTIFSTQTTVGLVRFYSARATARLAAILRRIRNRPPEAGFAFDSQQFSSVGQIFRS